MRPEPPKQALRRPVPVVFDDPWIADLGNDLACLSLTSERSEAAVRRVDLSWISLTTDPAVLHRHADLAW